VKHDRSGTMIKIPAKRLWIVPLDCCGLLLHAIQALAGDSYMVVEGEFEPSCFQEIEKLIALKITSETPRESRGSRAISAFSLTPEVALPLSQNVFREAELKNNFEAIQIVRKGVVQFISGDYFHPECVSVGSDISSSLLADWVQLGLTSGPLRRKMSSN